MSFYNPYLKTPDWGQGVQDILQQIMQIMLYKKYFPQNQGERKEPVFFHPNMTNTGGFNLGILAAILPYLK